MQNDLNALHLVAVYISGEVIATQQGDAHCRPVYMIGFERQNSLYLN